MSNSHLHARLSERWTNSDRVKRLHGPHSQRRPRTDHLGPCVGSTRFSVWVARAPVALATTRQPSADQITRRYELGFALTFYTEKGRYDPEPVNPGETDRLGNYSAGGTSVGLLIQATPGSSLVGGERSARGERYRQPAGHALARGGCLRRVRSGRRPGCGSRYQNGGGRGCTT